MRTSLRLAFAIIALSMPLAYSEEEARPTPTLPSEAEAKALVATAAKTFRTSLQESSSAEFRATFVMATLRDGNHGYSLCGEIKAKTSDGTAPAWHQFVALGGDEPSVTIEGPGIVEHLVPTICARDRGKLMPAVFGDHDYGKELQAAVQKPN